MVFVKRRGECSGEQGDRRLAVVAGADRGGDEERRWVCVSLIEDGVRWVLDRQKEKNEEKVDFDFKSQRIYS